MHGVLQNAQFKNYNSGNDIKLHYFDAVKSEERNQLSSKFNSH